MLQTVINPNTDQVKASIDQWNLDVATVNDFLNGAATLLANANNTGVAAVAKTALSNAVDEPCQLMTLASQPNFDLGPAAFTCAVTDLMMVFDTHVTMNLQTIIDNPTDDTMVQDAVDDINAFRCCNVLPDADILWLDSAADNGIADQVTITAERPDACANIVCGAGCKAMDNASFGK